MATYNKDKLRGKTANVFTTEEVGTWNQKMVDEYMKASLSLGLQVKDASKHAKTNYQIYTGTAGAKQFDEAIKKYTGGFDPYSFKETRTTPRRKLEWGKD